MVYIFWMLVVFLLTLRVVNRSSINFASSSSITCFFNIASYIINNFFLGGSHLWHMEVPSPGLNLSHSSNPNCCRDNAGSLTRCTTVGTPNNLFFDVTFPPGGKRKSCSLFLGVRVMLQLSNQKGDWLPRWTPWWTRVWEVVHELKRQPWLHSYWWWVVDSKSKVSGTWRLAVEPEAGFSMEAIHSPEVC